ncbi:hypothetical protein AAFC00_004690 [Neodothiora populina]|uniref:Erythromycin esterase n=1 Tax=Neodothiora populina TaxID=2781224 RepID=A0ABR3P357_9PEZI
MARRTSARLRAKVSSTPQPQRVSNLEETDPIRTPKTAPRLTSVAETDEMPGAFPQSYSPILSPSTTDKHPSQLEEHIAQAITGQHATPKRVTPIKPAVREMHPQKYHMSTAKPLDEARWLGFSSMTAAPHTEPAKGRGRISDVDKLAAAQATPTKAQVTRPAFEPPQKFDFTFSRPSLGLSPEARKLMSEKREEAAKIREQMLATEPSSAASATELLARKMATPKGKAGRFSDVHMSAFEKMDSIENHPAALRADTKATNAASASAAESSRKRTHSKADLKQSSQLPPRSTSKPSLQRPTTGASEGPAKRVKRAAEDDVATARPTSSSSADTPSTPRQSKSLRFHPSNPNLSRGNRTPTTSMKPRPSSIKSVKRTGIPTLSRSPSKPTLPAAPTFSAAAQPKQQQSTPLLARSPSKPPVPAALAVATHPEPQSPLLSRSAIKPQVTRPLVTEEDGEAEPADATRYMSRSPSKMTFKETVETGEKPSRTPLLARSPSKIAIPEAFNHTSATPAKASGGSLMARFNLLRASPIKSILRTPQRLYSNDPAKVANGTHFATPEKAVGSDIRTMNAPPKTAPVRKHVDFTASTKGLAGREETASAAPKAPAAHLATPEKPDPDADNIANAVPPKTAPVQKTVDRDSSDKHTDEAETPSKPVFRDLSKGATFGSAPAQPVFSYPKLPDHETSATKKGGRRKTMALGSDFTFRAGDAISFAPSSTSTAGPAKNTNASIRHVGVEPEMMQSIGKKRKLSGITEQSKAAPASTSKHESSDKENGGAVDESESEQQQRPAKKARSIAPEPAAAAAAAAAATPKPMKTPRKYSTLGVKPKSTSKPKEKRPGFLSQARLNALATPKRR